MSNLKLIQVVKPFTYGQRLNSTKFGLCKIYITPNIYGDFNNFAGAGLVMIHGGFDASQELDVFNGVTIQTLKDFENITKVEQKEDVDNTPSPDTDKVEDTSGDDEDVKDSGVDFDVMSTKELKTFLRNSGMDKKDIKGNKTALIELCKAV